MAGEKGSVMKHSLKLAVFIAAAVFVMETLSAARAAALTPA